MGYERERLRLTSDTVARARKLVRSGEIAGAGLDLADTVTPGLVLRVTKRGATWFLKTKKSTVRLGTVDSLTVPQARMAAGRARVDLERGEAPAEAVEVFNLAISSEMEDPESTAWGPAPVDRRARRRADGPWTVEDLIDEFVAWKSPRLREGYGGKWERYLRLEQFAPFAEVPVRDLRIETLEEVRDALVAAHPKSTAWRAVQPFKKALSWAWKHQARRSGLGATPYEWWDRLTLEYAPGVPEHTPTLDELARTLAVVEAFGLARGNAASAGTLPALWTVVLTAQRTGALVGTRVDYVHEDVERPGWRVIAWPREVMKSGRGRPIPHALPVPLEAWARIGTAANEEVLFPSRGGKALTKSALTLLFMRLAGERGGRDLFAEHGIRRWTPHDARRSLASFLDDRRLGGAASAILDHKDSQTSEAERTSDVTRLVYARAQRLGLKAEGMALWTAEVLAAYERERAALGK